MRTKILLLSAAALVAGVVASQAQSNVYSANIVGYVNKPLATNALVLVQNPLSDGTNTLQSTLGSLEVNSIAYVWNGSGYDPATRSKAGWSPNLNVPTGTGFFVKRIGNVGTNTFSGQVVVNTGASVTNPLTANVLYLAGSKIPYSTTLTNAELGLAGAPINSIIYQWNGTTYDPSTRSKAGWSPNLSIGAGDAFFIKPSSNFNWIQTLQAN